MSSPSPGFIERESWKTFLEEFSKRNQLRPTRVEVVGDLGAPEEEEYVPLVGIHYEAKGSSACSVEVILAGPTANDRRRVEKVIQNVQKIAPILGTTTVEQGLGFEDKEGNKTLVMFESLPEIERE